MSKLMPRPASIPLLSEGSSRNDETSRHPDSTGHRSRDEPWWKRNKTLRMWWWEMFCTFWFAASFLALVITIYRYDKKPLPEWPLGIAINAMVSIYIQIFKSSSASVIAEGLGHLKWTTLSKPRALGEFSAYDEAARGPWGSILLMFGFTPRWRRLVPCIAAFITLLLFPSDPFVQQIVQTTDSAQSVIGQFATVPRAQIYDEAVAGVIDKSQTSARSIRAGVRSAVNGGLFIDAVPRMSYDCPTGNCTLTTNSTSLGYCSKYSDATDSILREAYEATIDGSQDEYINFTLHGNLFNRSTADSQYQSVTITQYKNATKRLEEASHAQRSKVETFFAIAPGGFNIYESGPFSNINMVRAVPDDAAQDGMRAQAYDCSFTACLRSFNSTIENGQLTETYYRDEQLEFARLTSTNDYWAVADISCLKEPERQIPILRTLGYKIEDCTRWLTYNSTVQTFDQEISSVRAPRSLKQNEIYSRDVKLESIAEGSIQYYDKVYTANASDWNDWDEYRLKKEAEEIIPAECIYQMSQLGN